MIPKLAERRSYDHLRIFEAKVAEARAKAGLPEHVKEALAWANHLASIERGEARDDDLPPGYTAAGMAHVLIEDHADRIENGESIRDFDGTVLRLRHPDPKAAAEFRAVATRKGTPIQPLIEGWLAEQDIETSSIAHHRFAMRELLAWGR